MARFLVVKKKKKAHTTRMPHTLGTSLCVFVNKNSNLSLALLHSVSHILTLTVSLSSHNHFLTLSFHNPNPSIHHHLPFLSALCVAGLPLLSLLTLALGRATAVAPSSPSQCRMSHVQPHRQSVTDREPGAQVQPSRSLQRHRLDPCNAAVHPSLTSHHRCSC